MTCKDCYHYDICSKKDGTTNFYGKESACSNVEKLCQYFNDKSLIVELPCKIGTELFLSDNIMQHHRLKEYKFIGTRVVMVIECFEFQRTCKRFLDEHFGITVFLTKEEAETKLKELNGNERY
jgi:hypothetical protein